MNDLPVVAETGGRGKTPNNMVMQLIPPIVAHTKSQPTNHFISIYYLLQTSTYHNWIKKFGQFGGL